MNPTHCSIISGLWWKHITPFFTVSGSDHVQRKLYNAALIHVLAWCINRTYFTLFLRLITRTVWQTEFIGCDYSDGHSVTIIAIQTVQSAHNAYFVCDNVIWIWLHHYKLNSVSSLYLMQCPWVMWRLIWIAEFSTVFIIILGTAAIIISIRNDFDFCMQMKCQWKKNIHAEYCCLFLTVRLFWLI